jgi:septal ring factor EnvC (AmiA/AmiB activator)
MPVSYSPRPLLRSEIAGGGNRSALDTSVLNKNVGTLSEALGFARKDELDAVTDNLALALDKLDAVTDNLALALDQIDGLESRITDLQDGREEIAMDHEQIRIRNKNIDSFLDKKEAQQNEKIDALTERLEAMELKMLTPLEKHIL